MNLISSATAEPLLKKQKLEPVSKGINLVYVSFTDMKIILTLENKFSKSISTSILPIKNSSLIYTLAQPILSVVSNINLVPTSSTLFKDKKRKQYFSQSATSLATSFKKLA